MEMINETDKEELIKQQYRIIGSHSTVKICGWTKHSLQNVGVCYKQKFYGIKSHQCLQMSTSLSCANRCVFCWRGKKAVVSKEWKWDVDEPEFIFKESLHAQKKLLEGYGGNDKVNKKLFEESKTPKHVALSLTGEPIIYPRINEFIDLCNKNHISTFVVTNGTYPEAIENLNPVTQIYLSVDSPNKELAKLVGKPLFSDSWERFQRSVKAMSEKKSRTAIRITAIKNLNMVEPENYAKIINDANVDFVEVKAYMHVGESQLRLKREQMPYHIEVLEFAKEILKFLPNYEFVMEHIPSRVVLLVKKDFKINGKWNTLIDFEKYNLLVNSGNEFSKFDFLKETPIENLNIIGKNSWDGKYEEMEIK
ncbi:MAG: 4-demethylwyosine synthase TYW1 [Candidatus Woesearchaeota archaeon]